MSAIACRFSIILLLLSIYLCDTAQGQSRIAIPTRITADVPSSQSWTAAPSATGNPTMYGSPGAQSTSTGNMLPPPGLPGTTSSAPVTPYATPVRPAVAPGSLNTQTYVSPGTNYGPPGSVSPFDPRATAPPTGSYANTLPPPSPGLDPYATPGATPSPLLAQDPYFNYGSPAIPMTAMTKFIQDIRLDYHWFTSIGNEKKLGINDADLSATFAIPFLGNPNAPLLVTPGFGLQLWDGPVSIAPEGADLPPQTWDGYLDTAWKPQLPGGFGADLSFRVGIYSDFNTVTTKSIRFTGTALGVIPFSPNIKLKAGIMYLDRLQVKILPSGGIVWTPNPDIEFNILFPNPKLRKKLMNYGSAVWWIYGSGDYGGGSWTLKRANIPEVDPLTRGQNDAFDYDDIRVAIGLEFFTPRNFNGWFEVGGAFSRQIHYRSQLPDQFYPSNALFLRAGITY